MKITTLGIVVAAAFTAQSAYSFTQDNSSVSLPSVDKEASQKPQKMEQILSQYDVNNNGSLDKNELERYIQSNDSAMQGDKQARKGDKVTVTQKPAQVTVDQKPANITVKQPKPEVTITTQDPDISIDQRKPEVTVDQSDPKVRVSAGKPAVDVEREDPEINVEQPQADVSIESQEPEIEIDQDR